MSPAHSTKLLGTDFTASRRRSTKVAKKRLKDFRADAGKIQSLRRNGASALHYVRAAGVPRIAYGTDVNGASDSHLKDSRAATASAYAAPTAGKNPALTHVAHAAAAPDADPAYAFHLGPLKLWAMAWWEHWAAPDDMKLAFGRARSRLAAAVGSHRLEDRLEDART